jgi:hypothetical protein
MHVDELVINLSLINGLFENASGLGDEGEPNELFKKP